MNAATINNMSALDIIARSVSLHPSTFIERLQSRALEDSRYAATRESAAIKKSVIASCGATKRAIAFIDAKNIDAFKSDMSAGIIALNVACTLQCLPAHIRTQSAIKTWES